MKDYSFRKTDIEVTLDGYDPERGIGYEYLAASERGIDLSPAERAALAEQRILLVQGTDLDDLERLSERFLSQFSSEIPHTSTGTK